MDTLTNLKKISFPNPFVSLLSTGLDSPVATYLIMNQGFDCFSLSFLNGKDNSHLNRKKIIQIGQHLVKLTNRRMRLHFVDYDYLLDIIQESVDLKITCIICKRTMIKIASELARFYHAQMIVNGDILGEQASQTLDNIYAIHQVNKEIPVIRPLIGFDKLDIIKISQKLKLFDISLVDGPSCTYNPNFPETRADIQKIINAELKIDKTLFDSKLNKLLDYVDIN